jgi:hypothetical protein
MKLKAAYILFLLAVTICSQAQKTDKLPPEKNRIAYQSWGVGGYNRFKNKHAFFEEDSTVTFFPSKQQGR